MRREEEPLLVRVEPTSAIATTRSGMRTSGSRVGSHINSKGKPVVTFESPLGTYDYLFDIEPQLSGGRMIGLTAEPDKSSGLTVMTSYLSSDPNEGTAIPIDAPGPTTHPPTTYERSHSLLVQFGAGEVRHSFEIDVSEGSSANCPGHQVEVSLLDYTFSRLRDDEIETDVGPPDISQTEVYRGLRSFASVAAGAHPEQARLTQKVYTFYQVDVDLASPPNISDFKWELVEAINQGSILWDG